MPAIAIFLWIAGCGGHSWTLDATETEKVTWPPSGTGRQVTLLREIKGFRNTGTIFSDLLYGHNSSGNIERPVAVAVSRNNRMAVADADKRGVHLYDPAAHSYLFIYSGRDNNGYELNLQTPVSVIFDSGQRLYVTDSTLGKVFIFLKNGEPAGCIEGACGFRFKRPSGIAFSPASGALLLLDTLLNKLFVLDIKGMCQGAEGRRGTGEGEFNFPTHVATDRHGNIFITDALNFRIQIFSGTDNFSGMFGNHGDGSGDFAMPKGVAVDRSGIIYVVDTLFDNIQMFDRQGHLLLTVGRRGTGPGQFWMPSGIFIDSRGLMYVCDTYNHRLQVFTTPGTSQLKNHENQK